MVIFLKICPLVKPLPNRPRTQPIKWIAAREIKASLLALMSGIAGVDMLTVQIGWVQQCRFNTGGDLNIAFGNVHFIDI